MSIAQVATWIAGRLSEGDLIYVADDEARAAALAAAVTAAVGDGAGVVFVPASDALPGEDAPASPANAGQRVAALRRLRTESSAKSRLPIAVLASAEAIARRYPPPQAYDAAPPVISLGDALNLDTFEDECTALGYVVDERVDEPGEVAVRGSVVDLFPADSADPVRLEVENGRVAAIRTYDPADQRSIVDCASVEVGRAAEPDPAGGVTLLAHCPAEAALAVEPRVADRRARFLALAADVARQGRTPGDIVGEDEWTDAVQGRSVADAHEDEAAPVPRFVEHRAPLSAFVRFVRPMLDEGKRIVVLGAPRDLRFLRPRLSGRLGRDCASLAQWAEAASLPDGSLASLEMPADAGFIRRSVIAVAAADLLGSRARTEGDALPPGAGLDGVGDLRCGDVIVHEDHGIAIIRGIEAAPTPDGGSEDAIALEFADEARRLVPVRDAGKIWRYGADADAVTLDKLDGSSWSRRREMLGENLAEIAKGLVALAHERAGRSVAPVVPEAAAYERFSAGFPFTETADQARAIAAIRDDLASGLPMDRLVIGDVGYGKTEVALRAAAMVALSGGQVAVAAPTTVLARQHYEQFRARFKASGLRVGLLSRTATPAQQREVKAGLVDGSIAIVVGTAAIAGKTVRYSNLGLVVIDEEQRFGAADKARLRGLHGGHFLSLSATPIPRTLQHALIGLQQLSVIATPPARRQPIRTVLSTWDDARVLSALLREKARRGQSFVVVPRIEDMPRIEASLHRIVPDLSVVKAHGKVPAAELDTVMTGFAAGTGDVLLATNIIEAGLDVPRANTMIVWRADRFGLAQLHQLRGRVGRGGRRAQIMLLTDADHPLAEATVRRLRTLEALDRLGAGFEISARDLDMRGGGDLLGDSQTGHMKLIGVELYQHLLEAALRAARGEPELPLDADLRLGLNGHWPEDWIPEADLRLQLYLRLARLSDLAALDALEEELEDRFGSLPDEAATLLAANRIRLLARDLGIERVDAGPAAIGLTPRGDGGSLRGQAGLEESEGRWLLRERHEAPAERIARTEELLAELTESRAATWTGTLRRSRAIAGNRK